MVVAKEKYKHLPNAKDKYAKVVRVEAVAVEDSGIVPEGFAVATKDGAPIEDMVAPSKKNRKQALKSWHPRDVVH